VPDAGDERLLREPVRASARFTFAFFLVRAPAGGCACMIPDVVVPGYPDPSPPRAHSRNHHPSSRPLDELVVPTTILVCVLCFPTSCHAHCGRHSHSTHPSTHEIHFPTFHATPTPLDTFATHGLQQSLFIHSWASFINDTYVHMCCRW
jgi:hypothetical protein